MAYLLPLTELDAVNEMLISIGQAPVNTLAVGGIRDVNIARQELTKINRTVQLHGFQFNTDEGYTLAPDIDGLIKVPDGVLKIDDSTPGTKLIRRRHPSGFWAIWDGDAKSWVHKAPVDFKVTWGLVFDDLPDTARNFVAISAARKFQAKTIGAQELDGFNAEDEQRAWAELMREERAGKDTNLFTANATLGGSVNNRSY